MGKKIINDKFLSYVNLVVLTEEDYELNKYAQFQLRCTHLSYAVGIYVKEDGTFFDMLEGGNPKRYKVYESIAGAQTALKSKTLDTYEPFAVNPNPITNLTLYEHFSTMKELKQILQHTGLEFNFNKEEPAEKKGLKYGKRARKGSK